MRKLFIGLIFIFVNFNINIGSSVIGLIPNFIGYLYIYLGLGELSAETVLFEKLLGVSLAAMIYSSALYIADLVGFSLGPVITVILGLISAFFSLYVSYQIVLGIKDIEARRGVILFSEPLRQIWLPLAIMTAACYLLIFVPILCFFAIIACLALNIIFLVRFSSTRKAYEALN